MQKKSMAWCLSSTVLQNSTDMSNQEGQLFQHLAGPSPHFLPMLSAVHYRAFGPKARRFFVWLASEHRLAHSGIWFSLGMTADY